MSDKKRLYAICTLISKKIIRIKNLLKEIKENHHPLSSAQLKYLLFLDHLAEDTKNELAKKYAKIDIVSADDLRNLDRRLKRINQKLDFIHFSIPFVGINEGAPSVCINYLLLDFPKELSVAPDILVRGEWEYQYSYNPVQRILTPFGDLEIDENVKAMHSFCFICYPIVETSQVLMHVLLFHEFSHYIVDVGKYVQKIQEAFPETLQMNFKH